MVAGFTADTFQFLSDLSDNNHKEWFEDNRDRYKASWMIPAQNFVSDMSEFMNSLSPPHQSKPKINGSIRRINRDTRFSADKTPYNPALHIVFWAGDHPVRSPAIHYVIKFDSIGYGAGHFAMNPSELAKFRASLCNKDDREHLMGIVEATSAIGCELTEETLKKLPSNAPADTGHDTLFKRKGLVVRTEKHTLTTKKFIGESALIESRRIASILAPVNHWLLQRVVS